MTGNQAKKCLYCGKTFVPEHHRTAYCSEKCRETARKAQKQRYVDRLRQRINRPGKAKPVAEAIGTKAHRQKDNKAVYNKIPGAEYWAAMIREPGNTSPEYWEAFRGYELAQAKANGQECRTVVNGIAVADPDFVIKVLEVIAVRGVIVATIAPR